MEQIKTILGSYRHISLEPVFLLFCVNLGLIGITTQDLYLKKACKVNLNHSEAICDNIFNHTDIQVYYYYTVNPLISLQPLQQETQKYVSEIQAYNGMLQSAPGILFTLFAGPLSDQLGRKPLILSALLGYLLLDIIFLFNAVLFFELKVEYYI